MNKIILPFTILVLITISCFGIKQGDNFNNVADEPVGTNDTCRIIDKYLAQLATTKNFSGGLLIIKDGKKIFCKGYGLANKKNNIPFTSSTLASMGSITKAFTAAAIMKLTEQGKISVNDPLKKFFQKIPVDKENITIHQLLTHSSGFHEFLNDDGGDYEKIDTDDFLKRAFKEPLAFKPGEKAVYTNVGMSILGIIIERVSGVDYEMFLKNNLFKPIGISGIGYHVIDSDNIAHGYQNGKDWGTIPEHISSVGNQPYWNLKANGGLEASLDDLFLWANSFTNHKILNDSTIQKMFTSHIQEDGYNGKSYFGYGCNISTSRRGTKMISNGGSNGIYFAHLIRLPEEGLVFYMVSNESSINTNMVLPNITQLYFKGVIEQDAVEIKPKFENADSEKIYNILKKNGPIDLSGELEKEKITVQDDMVLLDVGRRLMEESSTDEALSLYQYYTKIFPKIVVAWNDMGDLYQIKNNKQDAIKCYQQALKLRPENVRAKENLDKITK
jgi:CubicO group peptidase (beta-lactamase class C family)